MTLTITEEDAALLALLTPEQAGAVVLSLLGQEPKMDPASQAVWQSIQSRTARRRKGAERWRRWKEKQSVSLTLDKRLANVSQTPPSPSPSSPPPPLLPPSSSPPVPPVSPPPYSPPSTPSPVPPSRDRARRAPAKASDEPKVQWAEYVTMTNAEHDKLLAAHGPADTARLIEILDNYKGAKPRKRHYESDYRAILSWVVDRLEEDKRKQGRAETKPDGRTSWSDLAQEMAEGGWHL